MSNRFRAPFRSGVLLAILSLIAVPLVTRAQPPEAKAQGSSPMEKGQGTVAITGLRQSFLHDWDNLSKKLVDLAEAIPAEKYTWRPAEGVRSVSEVFGHVAGANFIIPRALGIEPPEGLSRDMEKETDKAKVVATLKQSLDHVRLAVASLPDAKLDAEVDLFGQKARGRDVLLLLLGHNHEHLGQSIAYARMNGVVPPWSR